MPTPAATAQAALSELDFRWPWRPYQNRLLEAVEEHLTDDRLHLVAAPGAGKTTLGLEVIRRLGRPTLVLAPTLTIRDQWVARLSDFLPDGATPPIWTSRDLAAPAVFTAATYQALLSRARRDEVHDARADSLDAEGLPPPSEADVVALVPVLQQAGVGTIVLDEAHHLRAQWWKALSGLISRLPGVTLVSLTATPPFEATGNEWQRYEGLCGPIDEEISVPELVRAGTLCPVQDFVYPVGVTSAETEFIREHDGRVARLLDELTRNDAFFDQIAGHPWVSIARAAEEDTHVGEALDPTGDPVAVLDRPEVAVALLVLLRARGAPLPDRLVELLALDPNELPLPSHRWWEVAVREYLFSPPWKGRDEEYRGRLESTLRKEGILWRKELRIVAARPIGVKLAMSPAKIRACVEIHQAERRVRGSELRQVFLTDYIREGECLGDPSVRLGAWPVFQALRGAAPDENTEAEIGLITGRLSVVHRTRIADVRQALGPRAGRRLHQAAVGDAPEWFRMSGVSSGAMVRAFTQLMADGRLHVLVGTRSLLGEGWDAPSVNALVLASYIGAFVGTNQMRGRALRRDPARPDKVASVWHVAAVAPGTDSGSLDWALLEERFRTFVGLSADGERVESGMSRLDLEAPRSPGAVTDLQAEARRRLECLDGIREGWQNAVGGGQTGRVIPSAVFRRPPTLRPFLFERTLRVLLLQAGIAGAGALARGLPNLAGSGALRTGVVWLAGFAFLAMVPRLFKAGRLALRHAPIDGTVRQIGQAVLVALGARATFDRPGGQLGLGVRRGRDGVVSIALVGGSFRDQSVFADAMGEVLGPIGNPRYLIIRRGRGLFARRTDYHAVPTLLGRDKKGAEAFLKAWMRHVGPGELVYTRRPGGRRDLLAARSRAFSNSYVDASERVDQWQ